MELKTFVIIAVVVSLVGVLTFNYFYQDKTDFGGIEIESKQLKNIVDPLPDGSYGLCSLKDNKCVKGFKRSIG